MDQGQPGEVVERGGQPPEPELIRIPSFGRAGRARDQQDGRLEEGLADRLPQGGRRRRRRGLQHGQVEDEKRAVQIGGHCFGGGPREGLWSPVTARDATRTERRKYLRDH